MAKTKNVTGIDIGSDTIKCLCVKKDLNTNKISEVLFFDKIEANGVQKGRVKNPTETGKAIEKLILKAEEKTKGRLGEVFVSINGSKLSLVEANESMPVGRADLKVGDDDIDRIYKTSVERANLDQYNRQNLKVFPKEWIIDGEKDIKSPIGLSGRRIELKAMLLSAFSLDIESILEALGQAGIDISYEFLVPSPIADARAVLTSSQKELGTALISIGASTSSIVVFEEGNLLNLTVFPVGSDNITNDIAIGFKTEIEIAERLKKEYGFCSGNKKGDKRIEMDIRDFSLDEGPMEISIEDNKKKSKKQDKKNVLVLNEKQLKRIIEARVAEIFDLIDKEIKKVSKQGLLPGGIVLVGGGAKLPGIVDFAKKEFNLPCRIGHVKELKAFSNDPCLTTVCGLVLEDEEDVTAENHSFNIFDRIKNFFKNFSL